MGPLMKKFNFRLKAQLKQAQIPGKAQLKNGQAQEISSDEGTNSEDDELSPEERISEDRPSQEDEVDSVDESELSSDSLQQDVSSRKKSFFSVRRNKKPAADPLPINGQLSQKASLFKRKVREQPRSASPTRRTVQRSLQQQARMSFDHRPSSPAVQGAAPPVAAPQGPSRLLAFERGTFNLIEELNGLGEGGIHDLREQLSSDNKECSEKIKRLLHQHYRAFISASKGIRAMDGEMQALRNFLNKEHSLLNSLKEIADPQGRFADRHPEAAELENFWDRKYDDSKEGGEWQSNLQELDIVIAECRPQEALPLLKRTEKALLPGQKSGLYSHSVQGKSSDHMTDKQAKELAIRRQRLNEFTTSQIAGSKIGSKEMQVATQVLASLSGRADALKKHLEAHSAQLRKNIDKLLKLQNSGADADGTDFSNALGQQVFGAIAAASEDVLLIFGKELKDLASLFLVWALTETEKCALLLKRHALSPFAAPAGLGPTMACCLLAYIHCSAIQASHSIHLAPRLMRDLWPACDQVMQRRVKRVVEDVKAAVVHEVETLVCHGLPSQTSGGAWSDLMQVLPSADLLLDELEGIVQILNPMAGPRVREGLGYAFSQVFREYTNAIAAQFTHYRYADGTLPKVLDDTIEMALEVCHSMVEQFLPELAEPLKAKCGEILNYKGLNDQLVVFQDKLLPPQEELMDTLKTSILDTGMSDASWRLRQGSGRLKKLDLRTESGGSEYSGPTRVLDRTSSMKRTGRSMDASRRKSTDNTRSKFAEDDRMLSVQRRTRRSINEDRQAYRSPLVSSHSHAEPATVHDRHLNYRMGKLTGESGYTGESKDARLSRDTVGSANMNTYSTFAGPERHSSDSMSSTGEVADTVLNLQHVRSSSREVEGLKSGASMPGNAKADFPDLSSVFTLLDTRQGGSAQNTASFGRVPVVETAAYECAASGSGVAGEGGSDDEAMMTALTKRPAANGAAKPASPAAWPLRPIPSAPGVDSEEDSEPDSEARLEAQNGAASNHRRAVLGAADESSEEEEEESSDVDEGYLMSQLTKGANLGAAKDESSDMEEMNEELSDYDEDEMMAQLTKCR